MASDSAVIHDIGLQWDVQIPLRDGVNLSAILYRPRGERPPSPVIFTLTPYVAQTWHEFGAFFAAHGLPFLTIDVRGRGNSEGQFKANGNEAPDSYDIIEWLARQPYCNGKVAMWGGSYSGYVQWTAAKEFPPHLSTIVPVASPYRGVDSPAPNNIFMPYRIQWLMLLAGRTSQDKIFADQAFWSRQFRQWSESGLPFKELDRFLGLPSPIFQEWLRHPHVDEYWDGYNPTSEQYAAMTLPVLTITGSYDTNQVGALTHYREHLKHSPAAKRTHYLVIGPWDHAGTRTPKVEFGGLRAGPASLVDLSQLHLQWYAWTMQQGAKPDFLRNNVAYYVMGSERWRYADTLDQVTSHHEKLHLQSQGNPTDVFKSGSLAPDLNVESGPDWYVDDPRDMSLTEIESAVDPWVWTDQRMTYAATGRQLVYHSAPFESDTEITGFFQLRIWLSIDQPDADFRASVYDVTMDGGAVQLSADVLRARYRDNSRRSQLIETCDPLPYSFQRFTFVSRLVRRGSRLRLVIAPLHSIFWQRNHHSGGAIVEESIDDARLVTVKLFHSRVYPSILYVPIGQQGTND